MYNNKLQEDIEMDTLLSERVSQLAGEARSPRGFKGWRFSIVCGTGLAISVFILNLSLLIWASIKHPVKNNVITLYNGECSTMKSIFTWSHFAINILSTLLLSASNVCMQCLAAPTRIELDQQHALGKWLNIGVMSLRNLRSISRWRLYLWVALGLSSIPLHLLYNSVIFSTLSANEFLVVAGASNFINGPPINESSFGSSGLDYLEENRHIYAHLISSFQTNASTWENLTKSDCIRAYDHTYVSVYRNVLLVTGTLNQTDPVLNWFAPATNDWFCFYSTTPCHISASNTDGWSIARSSCDNVVENCISDMSLDIPIDYCLAQPSAPTCKVQLGQIMLVVVIICNAVKVGCMLTTIFKSDFQPLITTGDAISSFLGAPDETTAQYGPLSAVDVYRHRHGLSRGSLSIDHDMQKSFQYARRERWSKAASLFRWSVAITLCLAVWITALSLFAQAIHNPVNDGIWATGFGDAETASTINFDGVTGLSISAVVLIVNAPQLIISMIYIMYNNLFTCMLSAAEICDFGKQQKALRVSEPSGQQRSTYWLSLPYRYALPLIVLMSALHWFVSQSIFLTRIEISGPDPTVQVPDITSACGWSPKGLVASIVLGAFMIALAVVFGCRKFAAGVPVMSNCSIALSAACHPVPEDSGAALLPIKYGVLQEAKSDGEQEKVGFGTIIIRPLVDRYYITR